MTFKKKYLSFLLLSFMAFLVEFSAQCASPSLKYTREYLDEIKELKTTRKNKDVHPHPRHIRHIIKDSYKINKNKKSIERILIYCAQAFKKETGLTPPLDQIIGPHITSLKLWSTFAYTVGYHPEISSLAKEIKQSFKSDHKTPGPVEILLQKEAPNLAIALASIAWDTDRDNTRDFLRQFMYQLEDRATPKVEIHEIIKPKCEIIEIE